MKKVLLQIWRRWKSVARTVGRFQTRVVITIFYFLIISPVGLTFRLFGWDPLDLRSSKARRQSNWKPVRDGEPDLPSLRRQS